jgi:hypothetical protein
LPYLLVKTHKLIAMKAVLKIVSFVFLSVLFVSCQKEVSIDTGVPGEDSTNNGGNNPDASLQGNWNFVSLLVDVEGSTGFIQGGIPTKIVVSYKDTTEDNKGYITINSSSVKGVDLSYTFFTEAQAVTYVAGIPVPGGTQTLPVDVTIPTYSATNTYQLIGSDSLYFPSGFLFQIPDPTGLAPDMAPAVGAKLKITGTDLVITSATVQDTSFVQQGETLSLRIKGNFIANFKKQ